MNNTKKYFYKWLPDIAKIISGDKWHTIVILKDGRKGVVKPCKFDKFDYEKGILYAYAKAHRSSRVGVDHHIRGLTNSWCLQNDLYDYTKVTR